MAGITRFMDVQENYIGGIVHTYIAAVAESGWYYRQARKKGARVQDEIR